MEYNQAQALLSQIQGCTFASLDTVTIPALKGGKANPMQGKVSKHCLGHRVLLYTNQNSSGYENKVKRHLEREGKNPDSFIMGKLPWGKRIADSPFIENKGEYYLQCCFMNSGSVEYRANQFIDCLDGTWFREGEVIPATFVRGLNEKSGSEHQNLSDEVIVRTFKLSSIVSLRAFHEELN
jgi:hypothetical protein